MVMPIALSWTWGVGVLLLASRQPKGWLTTLAISPLGLLGPLWLYTNGMRSPWVAWPIAAALLGGCLTAMWRILQWPA